MTTEPTTQAGRALLADWHSGDILNRLPPRGLVVDQIRAIEAEARKGYVPESLSPEWHAELDYVAAEAAEAARREAQKEHMRWVDATYGSEASGAMVVDRADYDRLYGDRARLLTAAEHAIAGSRGQHDDLGYMAALERAVREARGGE